MSTSLTLTSNAAGTANASVAFATRQAGWKVGPSNRLLCTHGGAPGQIAATQKSGDDRPLLSTASDGCLEEEQAVPLDDFRPHPTGHGEGSQGGKARPVPNVI